MRSLYIDCTRGLATDMLCGALLDLVSSKESVLHQMQCCLPQNIVLSADYAKSYDRQGLLFSVKNTEWHHHHHGTHFDEVEQFVLQSGFSNAVKDKALLVYDIILNAECKVHGETKHSVHFHEVGQQRAIAGVLCACHLFNLLGADEIVFSSINTGYGKVICEHGEIDVPAPATKEILALGLPHFADDIYGELCTPTGCALAKVFATSFAEICDICGASIGIGTRDIGVANGVSALMK